MTGHFDAVTLPHQGLFAAYPNLKSTCYYTMPWLVVNAPDPKAARSLIDSRCFLEAPIDGNGEKSTSYLIQPLSLSAAIRFAEGWQTSGFLITPSEPERQSGLVYMPQPNRLDIASLNIRYTFACLLDQSVIKEANTSNALHLTDCYTACRSETGNYIMSPCGFLDNTFHRNGKPKFYGNQPNNI